MYDPYDEYMADRAPADYAPAAPVRRYSRAKAADGAAPGASALDIGSLALGGVGTVLGAYGTYKAQELAEKQHEDAMTAYRDEKARERDQDRFAEDQRAIGNSLAFGNYARQLEDDVYGTYSPWARSQGM